MRFVVDANVIVSSLLSGGIPFKVFTEFVPKAEKMLSGHLKDVFLFRKRFSFSKRKGFI